MEQKGLSTSWKSTPCGVVLAFGVLPHPMYHSIPEMPTLPNLSKLLEESHPESLFGDAVTSVIHSRKMLCLYSYWVGTRLSHTLSKSIEINGTSVNHWLTASPIDYNGSTLSM